MMYSMTYALGLTASGLFVVENDESHCGEYSAKTHLFHPFAVIYEPFFFVMGSK